MTDLVQELMTPDEAARWFRRSPSWLRQQADLLRLGSPGGQPLYHVRVCRAYILGRMRSLVGDALHQIQLHALAAACGLTAGERIAGDSTEQSKPVTGPASQERVGT